MRLAAAAAWTRFCLRRLALTSDMVADGAASFFGALGFARAAAVGLRLRRRRGEFFWVDFGPCKRGPMYGPARKDVHLFLRRRPDLLSLVATIGGLGATSPARTSVQPEPPELHATTCACLSGRSYPPATRVVNAEALLTASKEKSSLKHHVKAAKRVRVAALSS